MTWRLRSRLASTAVATSLLGACASAGPGHADDGPAPRLNQLGAFGIEMSGANPEARRWIEQGLLLAYGFEHGKAAQAFEQALREDPQCAMCAWGAAYVLGPNINLPREYVSLDTLKRAHRFARQADRIARGLPRLAERDRLLIAAIGERYEAEPKARREAAGAPGEGAAVCSGADSPFGGEAALAHPREQAYARAMTEIYRRFAADVDVAAMYAESLMMLTPWAWYDAKTRKAHPNAAAAIEALRKAGAAAPDHPGLIHFLIHATEQGPDARWAEAGADRLGRVAPGLPHLVHMPSHTYIRIGRYGDAVAVNQAALAADVKLGAAVRAQGGKVRNNWDGHHLHFLWFAAAMDGQGRVAVDAARRLSARVSGSARMGDTWRARTAQELPWLAMVQAQRWQAILDTELPPVWWRHERAVAHFARGMAHAVGQRDAGEAQFELVRLEQLAQRGDADPVDRSAPTLRMAVASLRGEVAWARGDRDTALTWLKKAQQLEEQIDGGEVASFGAITAPALGSALTAMGRAGEAEAVYRAQLARWPGDPRALHGLARSLAQQGRADEASTTRAAFDKAWQRADFMLAVRR